MNIRNFLLVCLWLVPVAGASAQPTHHEPAALTVYIVRHAERVNDRDDSPLTPGGRDYAGGLAGVLEHRDITHIWTSPLKRARDTARPLAEQLRRHKQPVQLALLKSEDIHSIERLFQALPNRDAALVVGRSTFVPELVKDLSGTDVSAERNQYYRLYRLVRRPHGHYAYTLEPGPVWRSASGAKRLPSLSPAMH